MKKQRALFVDDMTRVWDRVRPYLSEIYNVNYVDTREEALEIIKGNGYDLIISDYHLGEKSPTGGLDVVKAAREKGLKAILISTENHKPEALEADAEFMFKKQFYETIENGK